MARQVVQDSGCVAVLFEPSPNGFVAAYFGILGIPSGMISSCNHRQLRALVAKSKGSKAPVKATLRSVDSPSYRGYRYTGGETKFPVIKIMYRIDTLLHTTSSSQQFICHRRNVLSGNIALYVGTCISQFSQWAPEYMFR